MIRNIVSLRCSEELFDDLSDDPEDWAIAQQAELNAKPPTYTSPVPIIRRPFEESAWMEAIEFPFRQFTASRYSDGSYGVWYGADTAETSVYETVYHWRYGLLADAGFDGLVRTGKHESITSERKIYRVHCHAALLDLRPRVDRYPELIDPENYGFTQNIGARIHAEGHPGLTTRSARCTGDTFAVFNPSVLSKPAIQSYLTYRLSEHGVAVYRGGTGQQGLWFTIP
nr:RES family NAD+ phosphorylase [Acidithiobacillus caldus]